MPMKPTPPESLKGLAGSDPSQARILDDEEVEKLAAQEDEEDDEEVEE
jgi:hypothetical protein